MLRKYVALAAAAALVAACSADKPGPTELEVRLPLYATSGSGYYVLGTNLTGSEEVFTPATPGGPTPADSRAVGHADFAISQDGNTIHFRLLATHISNVIMAHIHCGRAGANGPIRIWLYPVIGPAGAPAPSGAGPFSGVLAQGVFSPTGINCPASAVGADMPVLEAIKAGLAYVNVHTNDGVAPTNTGPGDFPGGEIRGQLDH